MKILLDTNFLVYCAKQKIDYINEINNLVRGKYELIIITPVIQELKNLMQTAKKYSDKEAAKLALQLIKLNKLKILKVEKNTYVDRILVDLINKSPKNILATIDFDLARQVPESIIIRGKRKLQFR